MALLLSKSTDQWPYDPFIVKRINIGIIDNNRVIIKPLNYMSPNVNCMFVISIWYPDFCESDIILTNGDRYYITDINSPFILNDDTINILEKHILFLMK